MSSSLYLRAAAREQREELAARLGSVPAEAPAGARAALLLLRLGEAVGRDRAAHAVRLHVVEPRGIPAQYLLLVLLRERRVAELLLHLGGDLEVPERIDQELRRP